MTQFFEKAFSGKNSAGRYIILFVWAFIASNLIGGIPLIVVMAIKSAGDPDAIQAISEAGGSLVSVGVDPIWNLVLMLVPFLVGLIFFLILFKPVHLRKVSTIFTGSSNFRWGRLLFSSFVWIVISAIYLLVYLKVDPGNFVLSNTSNTLIYLALVVILLIPFQAAFEEVLFRGYLMQGFAVLSRNRWVPLIVTSLLFALLHSINPEVKEFGFLTMMPQYILFGLIFAIAVVMDDGLEIAIGAHAANNIFLSIFVTFDSAALQTPAVYKQITINPWTEFAGLAVMSVLFLLIMGLKYNWPSLKRLFSKIDVPVVTGEDQTP